MEKNSKLRRRDIFGNRRKGLNKLKKITLLVIDVDGTMTDAGIYYDEHGNEMKKFCTRDAAGFFSAHYAGIQTMVLTGRESKAVIQRMQELKADFICQNVKDKKKYLQNYMYEKSIAKEQVGYIGDDLNDIAAMQLAGFIGCPADACPEIKDIAHYISPISGGQGAVRDIIRYILQSRSEWKSAIDKIYAGSYEEFYCEGD